AGITLEVVLGKKQGTPASYYTQQFTWTPSGDLSQPYFEADLPMDTAGIDSLLGTQPKAGAYFEVKKMEGGVPDTVLSKRVTVEASVIHLGTLTVPPNLTPLSAEAAQAAFLSRTIVGSFDVINEVTGKGFRVYADEDGGPHFDPIT